MGKVHDDNSANSDFKSNVGKGMSLAGKAIILSVAAAAGGAVIASGMVRKYKKEVDAERLEQMLQYKSSSVIKIETPRGTVHADVVGEGDNCIILVHGLCCDGDFFYYQREGLKHKYKIVTIDLSWHGESVPGKTAPCCIEDYAEDVKMLIDNLNPSSFILGGHSMGGFTSFTFHKMFAKEYGDRLKGLIALNSTGMGFSDVIELPGFAKFMGMLSEDFLLKLPKYGKTLDGLFSGLSKSSIAYLSYKLVGFSRIAMPQDIVFCMSKNLNSNWTTNMHSTVALYRYDCKEHLPFIDVPVLLIAGGKDVLVSVNTNRKTAEMLPHAKLVVFENATHTLPLDHAKELNQEIDLFASALFE